MPKPVKIRPMRSDEWTIFHHLDAEVFEEEDQVREDFFLARVQKPGFFAMDDKKGDLVGYLILGYFTNEIAHLGRIGVRKSQQSQGLGSLLMKYALNWFKTQEGIKEVQLYTQVDNYPAQSLYKKFGFKTIGQTWHYFVPFNTLQATGNYSLHKAQPKEQQAIANLFPNSLPVGAIQRFLERDQYIYVLKDHSNRIIGATRFTPSFPGCFPFELLELSGFDDYVLAFQVLCDPPSEFLRITFHENQHLASLCDARGYRLHHKLHRMQLMLHEMK